MLKQVPTPVIVYPQGVSTFSTNRAELTISGVAEVTDEVLSGKSDELVEVNGDSSDVVFNSKTGEWSIQVVLSQGENIFQVRTVRRNTIADYRMTLQDANLSTRKIDAGVDVATFLMYRYVSADTGELVSYYDKFSPQYFTLDYDYSLSGGGEDPLIITRIDRANPDIEDGDDVNTYFRQLTYSSVNELKVYFVNTRELAFRTHPPVGVLASRYLDKVIVSWVKPEDARIDGFNVYASTSPQGVEVPYKLLTPVPLDTPQDLEETSEQLDEILTSIRRLEEEVGEKVIDENFDSVSYWNFTPTEGGPHETTKRGYKVLGFKSIANYELAGYKLRSDFSGGSRTHTRFETRDSTDLAYAQAGIHFGELSTVTAPFDPTQYVGVRWDANTGVVTCYAAAGYSYASDPAAYTGSILDIDIVVTGENFIEFFLNGELFHTTTTSTEFEYLLSHPISLAGKEGIVVHEVYYTVGEWVSSIETSEIESLVKTIERYAFEVTEDVYEAILDKLVYLVVTSVGYDPNLAEEAESTFSDEVVGQLLPTIREYFDHPERDQREIRLEYIEELTKRDPLLDLKPGSVVSDIMIGPPSVEFERAYVWLDFISRAQSFVSLLELDYKGAYQLPVADSEYKMRVKEAFDLTDVETQDMIDSAYDRLAANVNVFRKAAEPASGEITFYVTERPVQDLTAAAGTQVFSDTSTSTAGAEGFYTLARASITAEFADSYYNPVARRWETSVKIQAITPGEGGNVSANRLTIQQSGEFEGSVNYEPTIFGQNEESSRELAERAMIAFVSVDVGTFYGYKRAISEEALVRKSMVIPTEHALMKRTWDPLVGRYIGGKVDIYVRGESLVTVVDSYAIDYPTIIESTNVTVLNTDTLAFAVSDEWVTTSAPLYEVLEVFNETLEKYYVTDNHEVSSWGTFRLGLTDALYGVTNEAIGVLTTHTIRVTYRYRAPRKFILDRRPVAQVTRVTLRVPGDDQPVVLTHGVHWNFYISADPLLEGGSVRDPSYLQVNYSAHATLAASKTAAESGADLEVGLPSGYMFEVDDEEHTLVSTLSSQLIYLGVARESIVVKTLDGLTTYQEGSDYYVKVDVATQATAVGRIESGFIDDGTLVNISYKAGEQLEVEYVYDSVIERLQEKISEGALQRRHITADVLVKKAVEVPVFFDIAVVLKESANTAEADRKIRTAISRYITQLKLGESLYQSDVVGLIELVEGVSHVVIPFSIMARQTGAALHREVLEDIELSPYHLDGARSYRIEFTEEQLKAEVPKRLLHPPREAGGYPWEFKVLYEDNYPYKMVTDPEEVKDNYGRAYIQADGRVVVSPYRGPKNFKTAEVEVSYVSFDDQRVMSIEIQEFEYISVGTLLLSVSRLDRSLLSR